MFHLGENVDVELDEGEVEEDYEEVVVQEVVQFRYEVWECVVVRLFARDLRYLVFLSHDLLLLWRDF